MSLVDGYFVGLLSGTSIDAIDAALLHIGSESLRLVHAEAVPIAPSLRSELLQLTECETVSPDAIGLLDRRLGTHLAEAVLHVLAASGTHPEAVRAIGSHGQTIRHRPARPGAADAGFTWQIGDPNTIAELTGICTVADFRRRDVAAGGQGAPLVPAFHAWAFRSDEHDRVILNIGGMANISVLRASPGSTVTGFDTGPGNALLDAWTRRHQGVTYDRDGGWARSGRVDSGLLARLRAHSFFGLPAPKSTGREEFNLAWLDRQLVGLHTSAPDVQATLLEFTATTIADAIVATLAPAGEVFVCGGGAHNGCLMERLGQLLAPRRTSSTAALGLDPDWVEAALFGWLARQTLSNLAGNLPSVTGASHPVVLGAIHPGRALQSHGE
jgi:anhydro-N-acetylmuramic acid kinase